ncbi:hypothetical protein [Alkalibacillus silvisoli]
MPIKDKELQIWQSLYYEVFNEQERDDVMKQALKFIKQQVIIKQEG